MADGSVDILKDAQAKAYATPLDELNPAQPALFQANAMWPYFERLRKEAPVHYTAESEYGPYWSITKYNDIMAVDTNHQVFSSEPGITIAEQNGDQGPLPMFIAMDPPKHDIQRKTVSPAVSPTRRATWPSRAEPVIAVLPSSIRPTAAMVGVGRIAWPSVSL